MSKLNLVRPICFIDLESTGKDRNKDQIIEISILKLEMDGTTKVFTTRVKPSIPISPGAFKVHGISDDDVKDCKTFPQIAVKLHNYLQWCDIAGFASNHFDVPMLFHEFARCGIEYRYQDINMIDAGIIMKRKEERTLVAAYKMYCDKVLEEAHSAEADIKATYEVLLAQMERYEDLPETIEELALYSNYDKKILDVSGNFSTDDDGDVIYNFGPHRDKRVKDEIGFLSWMLSKDFPSDTMRIAQRLMDDYTANQTK